MTARILPLAIALCLLLAYAGAQSPLSSGTKASDLDTLKNAKFGTAGTTATGNLIPNWNLSDPTPLKSFRYDFPYQDFYVNNVKYVSQVNHGGKNCAQIDLPEHIVGNGGGKVETALVPAEPGATYRAEVSCMTSDFAAKIHVEAYCVDPRPSAKRMEEESKGVRVTIQRIPPMEGRPALVQIYRAQLPDPPAHSKKWDKVQKDFTIPMEWKVAGENVQPAYLTIKATVYDATEAAGKSFFTEFKLTKIKEPGTSAAPKTSGPASNKDAIIR
jgi:hypothetical protein